MMRESGEGAMSGPIVEALGLYPPPWSEAERGLATYLG